MPERRVDVGMPAHGPPRFLAEAIDSVLAQTHPELTLFVLDDSKGSEIERVVNGYSGEPRLQYRRSEPVSATRAMTELIGAGDAPYFAFLHDDDRWGTGFLAQRVEFLERHPECGFVFSGHVDIDADGRVIGRAQAPFAQGIVPREVLVPELLERSAVDVMHSVLMRRSALEEAGPRLDETIPRLFDWELWLRLALTGPAGYLALEDVEYRAHEEQMSSGPGRGRGVAELIEHADRLVAERAPELALDPARKARRDARIELSVAMDLLQEDDPRGARRALRAAFDADRRTVLTDRRLPAITAAIALGRPGRRLVGGLRSGIYRRGHRRRMRGRSAGQRSD